MKPRTLAKQNLETRRLLAAGAMPCKLSDSPLDDLAGTGIYYSRAIPLLGTAGTRVIEPVGGTRETLPNNGGFQIEIVPGRNLRGVPSALAATHRAAESWEAMFFDPITVTIHIDLLPASETPGILGAATPVELEFPYAEVRAAMQSDGLVEGDDSIVARLPDADSIQFAYPAGMAAGDRIALTKANAKALGLHARETDDALGVSDGQIALFGSQFDFNRSDGIDPGLFDFESVVAHEMGHILGFVSAVDRIDVATSTATVSPAPLDLFRFRSLTGPDNPRTPAAFESIARELRPSTPAVLDFVLQNGWSELATEYPVELGVDNGLIESGTDFGYQASHWQDEDLFGESIGIMAPVIAPQTVAPISNVDLRAFDLIGYDVLPPGVSASAPTLNDDQAVLQGEARVVIDILANDENNTEPLDVASFRIVEPPALGTTEFDPVTGLLVYTADQPISSDIDIFTYTIADTRGLYALPAAVEVSIEGAGTAPVAVDDFVLTREGEPVTFNPLANDFDPDETLSFDNLTVTQDPDSGTVTRGENALTYTPDDGFVGTDRLVYSIEDSDGNVSSATVEITVGQSLPPVVVPGDPLTLLQRADTNGDSRVSLIDALVTINYLGRHAGSVEATDAESAGMDVSGDGLVSPLDALLVINLLSRRLSEGEAWLPIEIDSLDRDDEPESEAALQAVLF